jgi:ABC-2 type transport system ATP-binding protein
MFLHEIIAGQSSATTFIISSHDLAEPDRLCQQILLLENGIVDRIETIALKK